MPDIIRINGTPVSWNSCSLLIDLVPYTGITAFDYGEKRDRKQVYGMRKDGTPMGKTSGKYSVTAPKITFLRSTFNSQFLPQMTALGLASYGDAEFPVQLSVSEPDIVGIIPVTVTLGRCTVGEVSESHAEGIDELVTEVTLDAISLTRNGMRLWSVVRGLGQ